MNRMANDEDIEELSKLRLMQQKEDWQEKYPDKDEEFFEITKNYLKEHLNKDIFFFIEIVDNKIVATCGLQIIQYMPQCVKSGLEGYICDVFTLKEYRRRGIQTNLVKTCISYGINHNVSEFKLSADNTDARRLYEKQGFKSCKWLMKRKVK